MGSSGGGQNLPGSNKQVYDLSIREIEMVMNKYEQDNMTLRRELHEARVKLNDKDEEILRLRRELLSQKKETLYVTRSIMALTDEYKKGQTQAIYNFLLNLHKSSDTGGQSSYPVLDYYPPPIGKLVDDKPLVKGSSSSGSTLSTASTAPVPKVPTDDEATTCSVCSEDDEKHVKAPLSYQYRHLRLQLGTGKPNQDENGDDGDEFLFGDHDATMYGVPYEPTGGNAHFS